MDLEAEISGSSEESSVEEDTHKPIQPTKKSLKRNLSSIEQQGEKIKKKSSIAHSSNVAACEGSAMLKWLAAGRHPLKESAAEKARAYETLHTATFADKWTVRVSHHIEKNQFYIDICHWANSDTFSRGAFIPIEFFPHLLAEMNNIPAHLEDIGFTPKV